MYKTLMVLSFCGFIASLLSTCVFVISLFHPPLLPDWVLAALSGLRQARLGHSMMLFVLCITTMMLMGATIKCYNHGQKSTATDEETN